MSLRNVAIAASAGVIPGGGFCFLGRGRGTRDRAVEIEVLHFVQDDKFVFGGNREDMGAEYGCDDRGFDGCGG